MAAGTGIEWTQVTWNPTTGCDRISAGCDNCYALALAKRLKAMGQAKYQADGDPRTSGPGFGLTLHSDALNLPYTWTGQRVVFVNSMSDLFSRPRTAGLRPTGLYRHREHAAAHLPGTHQTLFPPAQDRLKTRLAAEPVDGCLSGRRQHSVPGSRSARGARCRSVLVVRAPARAARKAGPNRDPLGHRRRGVRSGLPSARSCLGH